MKRTHWMWMVMACLCLLGTSAVHAAEFSGTVTDPNGFSTGRVPNATIAIEPGGYMAMTDANGEFVIANLPQGTYQLTVSHPDYIGYMTDLVMPNVPKHIVLSLEGNELPSPDFTLRVIVTTPDGLSNTPVVGALVAIEPGGYSGVTNDAGIVDFILPGGMYSITTSAAGYTNYTMDLNMDVSKQVVHSLAPIIGPQESPAPMYYFRGIITDPDGASNTGIPGVLIDLGGGYTTVTDSNGRFNFPSLPMGMYSINMTKTGYTGWPMDLRLDSDKSVVMSMVPNSMD